RDSHKEANLSHTTEANKNTLQQEEEKEAEGKIDNLKLEKTTLEQQIEAAGERIAGLEEELNAARDELAEKETAQLDAEKDEKGTRTQDEKTREQLNDLRLAIATARQRRESVETQRQPLAARAAGLVELIPARNADVA